MNAMQAEFQGWERGGWEHPAPSKCPCKGTGWALSNLDTWHKCQVHGFGTQHPENDTPWDSSAWRGAMRRLFSWMRGEAFAAGFSGDFNASCGAAKPTTVREWLDAAWGVLDSVSPPNEDAEYPSWCYEECA